MKATNKSRLKRLENKVSNSSSRQPLSIFYVETRDLIVITYITVKINEHFRWNGNVIWFPDNGREENIFVLTEAYLNSQPEIAAILKDYALKKNKTLALNFNSY